MREGRPRHALVVLNRRSRKGYAGLGVAADMLRAAGLEMTEVTCDQPQDLPHCILAHRHSVDCVILGGGDGTLHAAGKALVETGLPLGILPLGTANDFARSIGVPFGLEAAARVIGEGFTQRIDVGVVNGHTFFNVASVGIAADLAKSLTTERKRRFGRFSYALTAARLLLRAAPFHAALIAGPPESGSKVMVRTLQVSIGNGRFYGGGNVVAVDAHINDGYLHLYSLEFRQVWRMALMIPTFPRGAHGSMRDVRTARSDAFEIVTRKPRPVNADGEIVTQTPAVFTMLKQSIDVFVPQRSLATAPQAA